MSKTVRELLKASPITIQGDDDLALALQVMVWSDVRHLPVIQGDVLAGVLSERDVLRRYAEVGRHVAARERIANVMSSPPVTIGPNDDVAGAIELVTRRGIGCLPVVERGRLLGIVTRRDLLQHEIEDVTTRDQGAARLDDSNRSWTGLVADDIMSRQPLAAAADDALLTAVERMNTHGIRHLPVVDGDRRVIGMLSDRDVRTAIGNPLRALPPAGAAVRIQSTRVEHAMTREPLTLPAGTRLSYVAALFADHKVGAVPIVDEAQRLVGLVSYTDVLRAIVGPNARAS